MDFKQGMPVITSLRNQFLRPRHWQQIERLIGKTIGKDKSFTLGSLLEMNVRFMIMFKENKFLFKSCNQLFCIYRRRCFILAVFET